MKALVLHGARDVRYETVDDPAIQSADGAIVRVSACSICGSDLHPYHTGSAKAYCIGHEAIGEVVEAGSAVSKFKTGDKVMIAGSLSCGKCGPCLSGYTMMCENTPYCRVFGQGQPGIGGCQAEAVEVPLADANLWKVPEGLTTDMALVLTDSLPTGWMCAQRGNVRPGASVAVIGLGAIGQQALLSAFALGAEKVFALDLIAERREMAAKFGAIPVEPEGAVEAVLAATGGHGVDCVLDASGGPVTTQIAISIARKGGNVSVVGLHDAASVPFPAQKALARNLQFNFVACSIQSQLPAVIAAIEEGRLDPAKCASVVSHHMILADGAKAYDMFDRREDGMMKVVLSL